MTSKQLTHTGPYVDTAIWKQHEMVN